MLDLSRIRVCFIAGTLGQGGAERQLFYMLKALRQNGATIQLLCLTNGEFWEQGIREIGVPVTCVGQHGSRVARLLKIIAELRKFRPDIVQSAHFYTNLYAVLGARAAAAQEVAALRSDGVSEVSAIGRVLGSLSIRTPRTIASNSLATINAMIEQGTPAGKLHYLPNVVDTDYFKPAEKWECGPLLLVGAGRLVSSKRFDRFLSVLAGIRNLLSNEIRAIIAGDGPERGRLEQQAAALGLFPGAVEFRGAVPDIAKVLKEAHVFLMTSDREGTPNVLLEAMSCGVPVVATSVGGVGAIIRHGITGYLAEAGDEESLKDSVVTICRDVSKRREIGHNGRRHVLDTYSALSMPMHLAALYERVLS